MKQIYNYTIDIKSRHPYKFVLAIVVYLLIYSLIIWQINSADAKISLIQHCVFGLIPIIVLSQMLIKDRKSTWIIIGIYIFKTLLGIGHYLYFIDPLYFVHADKVSLTAVNDFSEMFKQITMFAQNMDGSYESFLANSALPHAEIYALMSIIFKYSGLYVLTIIPINVMSSLATSIMITYIVKIRGGRYRIALILTALFPLSLISSYFFRDMFAMSLLTFFLVLILLTKHTKIIILVITSYLFYLQRTPYVVIPMLAYMFYTFLRSENREKSAKELVAFLIFLLLVSISFDFISEGISDLYNDNSIYTSASRKLTTYILFPIKYFTAIVGPFPWTQVLDRPENTYMFQDFILSSSLFYVTFYFFPKIFRDISYKKSIDYLAIVGVLLMMMGVMSSVSHIGYVGWGLCYLVPTIVEEFNWKNFTVFTVKYFVFMLFFNLLYKMFNLTGFMHEIMG